MAIRIAKIIGLTILVLSASFHTIAMAADPVTIIVDGKKVEFPDAPAYIDENGRTQVPSRFIGEALGAKVEWDEKTKIVTFYRIDSSANRKYLEFKIGSPAYYFGKYKGIKDECRSMDTQALIENDRTYIPVRYIAEGFDAKVDWDASTRTVTVSSGQRELNGYVIPDSYTELVNIVRQKNTKAVNFSLFFMSNIEARLEKTLEILAQQIGPESISRIRTWALANLEYEPEDWSLSIKDTFLDPVSGQYIRVARVPFGVKTQGDFVITVYFKGDKPV